jgi:hypothetical protein
VFVVAGGKPHILFDGGQKQLKKYPKVWVTPRSVEHTQPPVAEQRATGYNGVLQQEQ